MCFPIPPFVLTNLCHITWCARFGERESFTCNCTLNASREYFLRPVAWGSGAGADANNGSLSPHRPHPKHLGIPSPIHRSDTEHERSCNQGQERQNLSRWVCQLLFVLIPQRIVALFFWPAFSKHWGSAIGPFRVDTEDLTCTRQPMTLYDSVQEVDGGINLLFVIIETATRLRLFLKNISVPWSCEDLQ